MDVFSISETNRHVIHIHRRNWTSKVTWWPWKLTVARDGWSEEKKIESAQIRIKLMPYIILIINTEPFYPTHYFTLKRSQYVSVYVYIFLNIYARTFFNIIVEKWQKNLNHDDEKSCNNAIRAERKLNRKKNNQKCWKFFFQPNSPWYE